MAGNLKGGLAEKTGLLLVFSFLLSAALSHSALIYGEYQLAKAVCFAFFTAAFLLFIIARPRPIKLNPVFILLALYFAYIAARTAVSGNNPPFHYTLALLAPAAFMIPHFIRIDERKFLAFINCLVFLASAFGIYQYAQSIYRPYSFFGNPVFFGEFLLLCLPLIAASFLYFEKTRPLIFFNMLLALTGIILASSRGVLASLLLASGLLAFYTARYGLFGLMKLKNKNVYLMILTVFIAFLVISPGFQKAFKLTALRSFSSFSLEQPEIKNRILMLKSSLDMAGENPVMGKGAGSLRYFYQKYQAPYLKEGSGFDFVQTSYAHNDYAQLASEFGLAGLGLYLAVIFCLFYFYERRYYSKSKKEQFFAAALVCSIAAFLIEGFFNFPLFILPSAALFWFLCGVLNSLVVSGAPENGIIPVKKGPALALAAAFSVMLIAVPASKPAGIISDFYLKRALALDAENSPKNYAVYKTALKYGPQNYYARYFLADSYARSLMYEKACAGYREALAVFPWSSDMLYNTGAMYYMLKDYAQAENYLKQALALYPGFALARLCLAKTYSSLGREQEAAQEFLKAKKIDPGVFDRDLAAGVRFFSEVPGSGFDR